MIPTTRLWIALALGIPFGAIAGLAGSPLLLVVYNVILLGTALATAKIVPIARLRIRREFDPVLSVRVRNKIVVEVANESSIPAAIRLRDEPPSGCLCEGNEALMDVPAFGSRTFEYWITPQQRGSDFFQGTFARLQCPLGLVERQVRLDSLQPVRIYPNVLALREFDLLKQKGRLNQIGIRRSRSRGIGTEFESLRDYALGDDYRKIDWKATARRGKFIVRQFEQERSQNVLMVIDTGRLMLAEASGTTKLDHTLDSLLMLAHAAAVAGDAIGLLAYSDTVHRYVPPRKGRGQLGILIEAIHDLVAEPVESDPIRAFAYLGSKWKRRSLLVVFTDASDEADAKSLMAAVSPQAHRHLTVVARVADPRLRELTDLPVQDTDDLFARSGGVLVVEERSRAAPMLSGASIRNLEAEPKDLAAALVSFYFDVKERSLL